MTIRPTLDSLESETGLTWVNTVRTIQIRLFELVCRRAAKPYETKGIKALKTDEGSSRSPLQSSPTARIQTKATEFLGNRK